MQATDGKLYGTTVHGGANDDGTVFKLGVPPLFALSVAKNGERHSHQQRWLHQLRVSVFPCISGTVVTLTASPAENWGFHQLERLRQGKLQRLHSDMNSARNVTAIFTATYELTVSKTGSGTVTSNDGYINCGSTCSHTYLSGTW